MATGRGAAVALFKICKTAMINRKIKAIALNASVVAILLTGSSASLAQSGAASLHGCVAFENVAYVDKQPSAKVVLQHDPPGSGPAYSTETDEHGFFEFPHTSLGRFKLEITAKGNGGISNGFRCCWLDCFSLISIFPRRNSLTRRQAEKVTSPCPLARKRCLDFKVISKSWHSRRVSIRDPSST